MSANIIDPLHFADDFLREWNSPGEFVVAHTSGSTGKPKEIRLAKADMRASARMTNERFGITAASVLYLPLSVGYIAGKMMVVRAIEADCTLIVERPSNCPVNRPMPIDLLSVVPSQVPSLLERRGVLDQIKNILVGGAAIDRQLEQQLIASGVDAFASYGMTETCSHVALRKLGSDIYRAMPGVAFAVDSHNRLSIRCPHMSIFSVLTNDVVDLLSDTSFRWLGRFDNVINSGGIKVFPENIEQKIADVVATDAYYISSQPDAKWGEVPILIIEGTEDAERRQTLMKHLAEVLTPAETPKTIKFVEKIARTASGKLKRS